MFLIFFLLFYSFLFVWFFSVFYHISNVSPSKNVRNYENHSKRAAQRMYKFIQKREDRKLKRLNASELEFYHKKKKWVRDTEDLAQKVQRRQKESLRDRFHLPVQTYGLNLEILGLQLTWVLMYFFISVFLNQFIHKKYVIMLAICLMISILLITRAYGILYPYKITWWRPWKIFTHIYVKGNKPVKFSLFLVFLYFKISVVFWTLIILSYGVFNWISQSFAYYRFRAWIRKLLIIYGGSLAELTGQIYVKIRKQWRRLKKKLTPYARVTWKKVKQTIIAFDKQVFKLDIKIDRKIIKYKKKFYSYKNKLKKLFFGKQR